MKLRPLSLAAAAVLLQAGCRAPGLIPQKVHYQQAAADYERAVQAIQSQPDLLP